MKRGRSTLLDACVRPYAAARRAVLGDGADAPPRLLIRVDEFPHASTDSDPSRYGAEQFAAFHELMKEAGLPYLLAVLPRVAHDYLDPRAEGSRPLSAAEKEVLRSIVADGVTPAAHGLDHRTRSATPRRWSELSGRSHESLTALLDRSAAELQAAAIEPSVFVPPFNRFDADQLPALAERFEIVCGGPETVAHVGLQRTPTWLRRTVYVPAYPPLYGTAGEILEGLPRVLPESAGLWLPVVLHWGGEADAGFEDLKRFLDAAVPLAATWNDFLEDVRASRSASVS